jgi:hypothetical protein
MPPVGLSIRQYAVRIDVGSRFSREGPITTFNLSHKTVVPAAIFQVRYVSLVVMEAPFDTVATLEARGSEVRELVQEGEVDLAVRRLLDLAKDFAAPRELRNETLSISAKHNSLKVDVRRYGVNADIKRNQDVLIHSILELIDLIEGEAFRRPTVLLTSPDDAVGRSLLPLIF